MSDPTEHAHEHHDPVLQEEDLVSTRPIVITMIVSVYVSVFSIFVSGLMLWAWAGNVSANTVTTTPRQATREIGIIDQTLLGPERFGLRLKEQQEEQLHHYGWVDPGHTVARIPIDDAMRIVLERSQ